MGAGDGGPKLNCTRSLEGRCSRSNTLETWSNNMLGDTEKIINKLKKELEV